MYKICDWLFILFKCKQHRVYLILMLFLSVHVRIFTKFHYQTLEISTLPASYKLLFAEHFIVNVGLSELNDIYDQPIFMSKKDDF